MNLEVFYGLLDEGVDGRTAAQIAGYANAYPEMTWAAARLLAEIPTDKGGFVWQDFAPGIGGGSHITDVVNYLMTEPGNSWATEVMTEWDTIAQQMEATSETAMLPELRAQQKESELYGIKGAPMPDQGLAPEQRAWQRAMEANFRTYQEMLKATPQEYEPGTWTPEMWETFHERNRPVDMTENRYQTFKANIPEANFQRLGEFQRSAFQRVEGEYAKDTEGKTFAEYTKTRPYLKWLYELGPQERGQDVARYSPRARFLPSYR